MRKLFLTGSVLATSALAAGVAWADGTSLDMILVSLLRTINREDDLMRKLTQLLTMAAIGVGASAIALAGPTFTTVDFPGALATSLNGGPNQEGTSVGTYIDLTGVGHGFTLEKGIFTAFDPPGSVATSPNWISPEGTIVGEYVDSNGAGHGFILAGGKYTTVDYPGAFSTSLDGITPSGEMVGTYCASPTLCANGFDHSHSFVLSERGVFTSFDPPGASSSGSSAVTPSGTIAGTYATGGGGLFGNTHGYLLRYGVFTTIDYPGAQSTFGGAINPEGTVVGEETDAAGNGHAFILSGGTFTAFDYPGAVFTDATGINPSGIIVGVYFDAAFNQHGFIRTP